MSDEILNALSIKVLIINLNLFNNGPKQLIKKLLDSGLLVSREYSHVLFVFFANDLTYFVVALNLHLLINFKSSIVAIII